MQSVSVGWERYGLQSDVEYFDERMKVEGIPFRVDELNWANDSAQAKPARIDRLEPDFRNHRLLLPLAVHEDGEPKVWHVDANPESKTYQTVIYEDFRGLTKKQQEFLAAGEGDLLARSIKRLDSEKQVYDVTVRLIEEYLQFPVGLHDDLLDALSRFYDMDMALPVIYSPDALSPNIYADN